MAAILPTGVPPRPPRRSASCTSRSAARGMPIAERVEQARDLWPLLEGRYVAGETECYAHLLDVVLAARADGEVRLEPLTVGLVERVFEVVRDELHELLAGHVGRSSSSGYTNANQRTPARCRF